MMPLSIGKAWEETVGFVKREGALLFPVAFLFMALPMAIWPHLIPPEWNSWTPESKQPMPPIPVAMWLGFVVAMIATSLGSLALFSLALRPGISVGEALRLALSRLPVLIGAALLVLGAVLVAALAGGVLLGLLAIAVKPLAALLGVILTAAAIAGIVYASVRLILLNPVVLDRTLGPIASLRAAWGLGKGHFWRLLAFLAVILVVTMVASGAAQAVFGSIGGLVGGASAALLIGGLASALVSAAANVYILVMLARIYGQLQADNRG